MENFWLDGLPSIAAVVGSLLGIIVALKEFGAVSRARRQATFWKEQLEATSIPYDQTIAQSLYRDAAADVIALDAYPGWKLASTWLSFVLTPIIALVGVTYVFGTTITGPGVIYSDLAGLIVIPFILVIALQNLVNTIIQRRLLANQYLQGARLDTQKRFDKNANDITPGSTQNVGQFIGTVLFCVGVCIIIGFISFMSGAATTGKDLSFLAWISVLPGVGAILVLIGIFSLDSILQQGLRKWVHPRDLPLGSVKSLSGPDTAIQGLRRGSKRARSFLPLKRRTDRRNTENMRSPEF